MISKQSQVINDLLSFSDGIIISSSSFVSFYLFFDLPSEVILSAILYPIKSHVASALF